MKHLLLIIPAIIFSLATLGQFNIFEQKILQNDSLNEALNREKLFVHYDKPIYKINDTMWLKAYILIASENAPHDSIGLAYVEIINEENAVVKRISVPCYWGYFFSNIPLRNTEFKQGTYKLLAYTNWMRNFGDSLFFEGSFKIIDPAAEKWRARIKEMNLSSNHFKLYASITSQSGEPLANRLVSLRLHEKRNLLNIQLMTDSSGNLHLDTLVNVAAKNRGLILEITDEQNLQLKLPVVVADNESIDLQFLPEGGAFIAGKQQVLGFKALNVYGKGVDVAGVIKDSSSKQIASFTSVFKGMGTVSFTPEINQHYIALLDNGTSFKLPDAKTSGTILQIINNPSGDSVQLKIDMSTDLYGHDYYFAANARGANRARGRVKNITKPYSLVLPKSIFPSSVVRFTLYDENFNALNERATFIWHGDDLKLDLTSSKTSYQQKDSVSLILKAKNANNENIRSNFSISVIDTSQIKMQGNAENLLSYMLLSSDLTGNIEEPYYYFKNPRSAAIEALMLTQGWVKYDWKMITPVFPREREFSLSGKVTNVFNKPVPNANVTMFAREGKTGNFFLDTVTNKKGIFYFHNFPYFINDSVSMLIKALNRKGKEFGIGIVLDEPSYPEYKKVNNQLIPPDKNILFDTAAKQYVDRYGTMTQDMRRSGKYLQEVIVKANIQVPGSKNLNKGGGADQTITDDELKKMPKESLLDVLKKEVKGFQLVFNAKANSYQYKADFSIARFIIDGIDLDFFYFPPEGQRIPTNDKMLFLDKYLKYFSAEDVAGIEIMKSPRYVSNYRNTFLSINELINPNIQIDTYTFIEITTKKGSGPFLQKVPGEYIYRPMVPVISKSFYSPRYTSPQEETAFPDMRSTIYWNPEVMTNDSGEAKVSFYTSESKSSYLVILQGMDFRGGLGVLYQYLNVNDDGKSEKK